MIKAVFYDIGGVLIDYPAQIMIDYYYQHFNNVEKQKFTAAHDRAINDFQKGIISEKEFWQKVNSLLGTNINVQEGTWLNGLKKAYKEKPDIFSHIKSLRKKGIKVGILSNIELPNMNFLKEKYKGKFDTAVYSCEENIIKPNKEIYQLALNKLQVKLEETIFIDDKIINTEAAKKLGIHTILFKTEKQYFEDFKKI